MKRLLFILIISFITIPNITQAAVLYIETESNSYYQGDTFIVEARVETEECINTIEADLSFPQDILEVIDFSQGNSILVIWLEKPVIKQETGSVSFTGGIPGGYCGRLPGDPGVSNLLGKIIFKVKKEKLGQVAIKFLDTSQVLLNDGFGTPAELKTQEGVFNILSGVPETLKEEWQVARRDAIISGGKLFRQIVRCTSPDFIHWTEPKFIDLGDTPLEHLYTNATTPYFRAPHIYLAFPRRFVLDRKYEEHPYPGVSDAVFMSSRDGVHFDRTFMEAFVRRGLDPKNWTDRDGTPAWGVVPTGPEEISLYLSEHLRYPTHRLRRFTLRTDGFVSVHADYDGGEFVTKPLAFEGRELVINYSTSAVGSVKVEFQGAKGEPVPGYTLQDSAEIYGDEIEHAVGWKEGGDLSHLAGQPVRLRFVMKDADLYSICFR